MKTLLLLTVGGSHQPLVRSIEVNRPDFIHFLCSDDTSDGKTKGSYSQVIGEGNVLKSRFDSPSADLPNIAKLSKLTGEQLEIHKIKHFDDLNECYMVAIRLIERIRQQQPDAKIIVDYTGGTKSMTAGLAAAALDDGRCEIQLVTGLRRDLKSVTDKTEFARPVKVWDAQVRRRMQVAGRLIARYDYAGAVAMLEESALRFAGEETIGILQEWITLCRAFDAWDKFDHKMAHDLIHPHKQKYKNYTAFLSVLLQNAGHGFELVEDLLLNTERRATQNRYDDAVARIYRSLELTAQSWLIRRYNIDTSNVLVDLIPASFRLGIATDRTKAEPVKIGLLMAWDLIAAMDDDPLGKIFTFNRSAVLNFLLVRNNSIFAHGVRSVTESDYRSATATVINFIHQAVNSAIDELKKIGKVRADIKLEQLPAQFPFE